MKTLLLTLGDSWTHGVGCYEPELKDKFHQGEATMQDLFLGSFDRFSKYGWPTHAAKHLDADVKNLAFGGDANSAAVKRLLMGSHEQYRKEYDQVVVVFLMTDPSRFSFYHSTGMGTHQDVLQSYMPALPQPGTEHFIQVFLQHCLGEERDELLEMAFYLKMVEVFCKAYDYHFYYGSAFYRKMEEFHTIYTKTNSFLHNNYLCVRDLVVPNPTYLSELCGHPNENGYAVIGDFIGNYIKQDLTTPT